jgi:hypothetical protein
MPAKAKQEAMGIIRSCSNEIGRLEDEAAMVYVLALPSWRQ